MTRATLSTIAVAALLSVTASAGATAKTETSFIAAGEPLHATNPAWTTAAPQQASPDRSLKSAFTLIELYADYDSAHPPPKGQQRNGKGLSASPGSGSSANPTNRRANRVSPPPPRTLPRRSR